LRTRDREFEERQPLIYLRRFGGPQSLQKILPPPLAREGDTGGGFGKIKKVAP